MIVVEKHIVPALIERERLSDYLVGKLKVISTKKGIKKAIKKNLIRVDGKVGNTGDWVKEGNVIELLKLETTQKKVFKLGLSVVHEDEYLAVINKPSGYVVSGNQFKTIENALPYNLKPSKEIDALEYPQPVHRLDAPTSGLLLIAKTRNARVKLGQLFEKRTIKKIYHAIVIGQFEIEGTIDAPIDDKEASTYYKPLAQKQIDNKWLTLVELSPATGRKHQLRKHLSTLGFPILGDNAYGQIDDFSRGKGLYLCASVLHFEHFALEKNMAVKTPLPIKFQQLFPEFNSSTFYFSSNQ